MLFGFSSIKFLVFVFRFTKRQRTGAVQDASRYSMPKNFAPASWTAAALRRFSPAFQVTKISARSLRGLGEKIFRRSASSGSIVPTSSANIRCCFFNSTITSGDGGAEVTASLGELSRMEKFTAKISIHTAASPAHALG